MVKQGLENWLSTVCLGVIMTTVSFAIGAKVVMAQNQAGALPEHVVSFFNLSECPSGWRQYSAARGRFVVPLIAGVDNGSRSPNDPLKDGEERRHGHRYSSSVELASQSFTAFGGGNDSPAKAGRANFSGNTADASRGLPYVQLLMCQKMVPPEPKAKPIPMEMLMFFGGTPKGGCPGGWSIPLKGEGRLLVGLPVNATPNAIFGGSKPLNPQEPRFHSHQLSGRINFAGHALAIASGCCLDGFGKAESEGYGGNTDNSSIDLPYIMLQQCEKN